ncbi:MAG TPA: hypothetical protein VGQ65_04785 [Thermoanaerobaculia bacterium]|nr:hypothetical protein [Thermoanaerobaculia bacterium]
MTIQPGEVKALDDIVHSTFNLTDAGGALHVTTAVATPLVVTARTFNDTAADTLGQFLQAVTPADAVGTGERSLQLLQMEESPRYRTNLGLAEVTGNPATAKITVILPDSKVAPKVSIPLASRFRIPPVPHHRQPGSRQCLQRENQREGHRRTVQSHRLRIGDRPENARPDIRAGAVGGSVVGFAETDHRSPRSQHHWP